MALIVLFLADVGLGCLDQFIFFVKVKKPGKISDLTEYRERLYAVECKYWSFLTGEYYRYLQSCNFTQI